MWVDADIFWLKGSFAGQTVREELSFDTWDEACDWCGMKTMDVKTPFVVLTVTNPETGETEKF